MPILSSYRNQSIDKRYALIDLGNSKYFKGTLLQCNLVVFHDGGPYHKETSALICKSMDWFLNDRDLRNSKRRFFSVSNISYIVPLSYPQNVFFIGLAQMRY